MDAQKKSCINQMKHCCNNIHGLATKPSKWSGIMFNFKVFILCLSLEFSLVKADRHPHSKGHEKVQTVCYGHLGCFSSLPPFSPTMPLPMPPRKIQTKYLLRTRKNMYTDQHIQPEAGNLTASLFDPMKPTKIIIHGFVMLKNTHLAQWVPEVTETILFQEDVNVIQVSWVKGAAVSYDHAASNTRVVGAQVGHLINMLMEVRNAKAKDFHLVGFSLGAHVAGFAAKKVRKGGKKNMIGRITGLDPANPGFNYDNTSVRLDRTDAKFVDVIHTDTRTVLVMASGMNRNLGHIDFYPNGGADQTGCHSWKKDDTWMSAVTDSTVCDHLRATDLFKYSINATGEHPLMIGYKCDNYDKFKRGVCLQCRGNNHCRRMGYWAKPLTHNKRQLQYYLVTSGESPFTVNHYQVQIHWRNGTAASKEGFKAKIFITLHGDQGSSKEFSLNGGSTFHVHPGQTTRFLLTQNTNEDIGNLQRVTFRWERPGCWTYFFCSNEDINLKRIKVIDGSKQRKMVFYPLGKNKDERIKSHFVKPNEDFELLRTAYIRNHFSRRYKALDKEEPALMKFNEKLVHPAIISVHKKKTVLPSLLTSSANQQTQQENSILTTPSSS